MFLCQLLEMVYDEFEDLSIMLCGLEGMMGSGPQIVLQLVAIVSLRPPGPVQIGLLAISVLLIGKAGQPPS